MSTSQRGTAKVALSPVITYPDFYPGKKLPLDPLNLLKDYSIDNLIHTFIWIKNSLYSSKDEKIIHDTFYRRIPTAKAIRLRLLLNAKEPSVLSHPIVIAKVMTGLFRSHSNNFDKDLDEVGFEELILDVILVFNTWQYKKPDFLNNPYRHESLWQISLAQHLTGIDNVDYARTSNIKHLIFLNFLKKYLVDKFQLIEREFFEKTGEKSLYGFILSLLQLFLALEDKLKEKTKLIWFDREDTSLIRKFEMIVDKATVPNKDFTINDYVSRPYYQSGNKIYVTDHTLFAFALEKSWPYYLYKNSSIKNFIPGKGTYNDFLSFLGKFYYEEFLISKMLLSLHKSGFRYLGENKDLPDATYVINENTVMLFEVKSVRLHHNTISDQNVIEFKKFIDEKFTSTKKGEKQLRNAINTLSFKASTLYKIKIPINKITVYPIIIYTESNLTKYAVNDYVNQKFAERLGEDGDGFKEIKPLVMIHYNFFIENLSLFERDRALLKDSLDHFINYWKKKSKKYEKFGYPFDYLSSKIPFDQYIIGYKKLFRVPQGEVFRHLAKVFKLKN